MPLNHDEAHATPTAGKRASLSAVDGGPTRVSQVMHDGVEWAGPDTPVAEIGRRMRQQDVGAIPIVEFNRVVGMVTDRDIVCRCLAVTHDIENCRARDVMTRGAVWCRAEETLANAAHIMGAWKVRRLPVINRDRRMIGILALGDISVFAPQALSCEVLAAVTAHHGATSL